MEIGLDNIESVSVFAPLYLVVDMDLDKRVEWETQRVEHWEVDVENMVVTSVRVAMEGVH